MPSFNFFRQLGLFIQEGFLPEQEAAVIQAAMQCQSQSPAELFRDGDQLVDETVRKTKLVAVSEARGKRLRQRILGLQPALEQHFQTELGECEGPQFLLYHAGDFFQPHRDRTDCEKNADQFRSRKVSIVIFINGDDTPSAGKGYTGGALTFYGLIDNPPWKPCGFPLVGQPGLLIAFRSEVTHAVEPVLQGTRYTAVSWFH